MRTLLDDTYAPVTSKIGFVRAKLDDVVAEHLDWMSSLGRNFTRRSAGEFPRALQSLVPLTSRAIPRRLWVEHGEWTAYFDCNWTGSDPFPPTTTIAERLAVQNVIIAAVPDHLVRRGGIHDGKRYGGVQFSLRESGILTRSVEAVNDGGRWVFDASGTEQLYEEPEQYAAKRVRDRFTSYMLERYCEAIGIRPFTVDAYGPTTCLLQDSGPLPPGAWQFTFEEAQDRLGIVPGKAADLPG